MPVSSSKKRITNAAHEGSRLHFPVAGAVRACNTRSSTARDSENAPRISQTQAHRCPQYDQKRVYRSRSVEGSDRDRSRCEPSAGIGPQALSDWPASTRIEIAFQPEPNPRFRIPRCRDISGPLLYPRSPSSGASRF